MSKARNDQAGFTAVGILLPLICVAIGLIGIYVATNSITKANKTTTPVAKPTTNTTTPQTTVVKLPELGVQITLPAGTLTDFKYVAANVDYSDPGNNTLGTYPTAYLGTKQLDTLGCPVTGVVGNAPPLGFLTKTIGQYPASPTADNTTGTLLKQYPDFYISYRSRGFACFDDTAKNQIVITDNQQLQTALKTLDLIK